MALLSNAIADPAGMEPLPPLTGDGRIAFFHVIRSKYNLPREGFILSIPNPGRKSFDAVTRFIIDFACQQHEQMEVESVGYFEPLRIVLEIKDGDKNITPGRNAICVRKIINGCPQEIR